MALSSIFKLGQQANILLSNMDAYESARDKAESKYYRQFMDILFFRYLHC